jgi:UDP:flavonoid glycosyltransferase YjiC (YdhE family)
LGIGPAPIPHRAMTADKLAAAIDTMLNDSEMRRKASMLGQRMRSEDGARRAVEIVEQLVDQADPVADRPHHL